MATLTPEHLNMSSALFPFQMFDLSFWRFNLEIKTLWNSQFHFYCPFSVFRCTSKWHFHMNTWKNIYAFVNIHVDFLIINWWYLFQLYNYHGNVIGYFPTRALFLFFFFLLFRFCHFTTTQQSMIYSNVDVYLIYD